MSPLDIADEGAAPPVSQWQTAHPGLVALAAGVSVLEIPGPNGVVPGPEDRGPGGCVAIGFRFRGPIFRARDVRTPTGQDLRRCAGRGSRPTTSELCACWCAVHLREKTGDVYRWVVCAICGRPLR